MQRIILLLLLAVITSSMSGFSQVTGCTDPQALNYNPEALTNDGSCIYPKTSISPETIVGSLPAAVSETSGLIYWNGGLWTQNDSGNAAELYKLDTITGQILQTVIISGAENVDWEDLAQDETHMFIGDFGNNLGNRTDFGIYKVEKSLFPISGNGSVMAESIHFSYGDQTSFEVANRNNDFDCESMLASGDSLYLFTKNWVNEQTRLYALPKNQGTYTIYPLDQFDTDGLITGADILSGGSEIILCGYKNYNPFIWLLFDFQGADFFGGNKRRISFSGILGTQTEGISYTFGRNVFISAEKTMVAPAKLFRINTAPWTQVIPTATNQNKPDGEGMLLYPNPNDGNFRLGMNGFCEKGAFLADIINSQGAKIVSSYPLDFTGCAAEIQVPELDQGFYLFRFYTGKEVYTTRLLVDR